MRAGSDGRTKCFSSLTRRIGALFILLLMLAPALAGSAWAAQLGVIWDANGDTSTVGYKIYYGTQSKSYTSSIDVGNKTQCTVTNLKAGTIYYFAATAYDANGNESDYSTELAANTPSEPIPSEPVDTDGDGLSDSDETTIYGTDPNNADSDDDGLNDAAELTFWGGNWDNDADGDGIINLLDAAPYVAAKRANMGPILALLLDD